MSVAVAEARPAPGALGWLASTDHKRIGLMTIASSFVFFLGAGLIALLMRSELARPGVQIVSRDAYNELFTMHGSTMIYSVVTPFALGLGVYLVPLQIGASGISGPRLTLAGFWLNVLGTLVSYLGFATSHGAAKDGWTGYYPLSSQQFLPGVGMDFWLIGVSLAVAGQTLIAVTILATIFRHRAAGMTMLRLPPFTWTMVVSCFMVVASFPVLNAALALTLGQREFGWTLFDGPHGPALYQNLFWFYAHPVVYVMFFPFVGCVAEAVSALSRKRFFGYKPFVLSMLAFAAMSMAVWGHHMFTTGYVQNEYFALTSTLLLVPAGVEYFDLIATMWGGKLALKTPMLFSIGFLLQFLIGGVSGIWVASPPLDYHAQDSYIVIAHFHYTLFAGSVFGFFAGLYYWFPKFTGALLREGLGKLHFWLLVVGTNLTFFPMFVLGWNGMVRRTVDYQPSRLADSWLNLLESIGAGIVGLGILVFCVNVVVSLRRREIAADPWEGHSLEWWAASPPPRHNFDTLPPIRSSSPVHDYRLAHEAVR